MSTSYGTSYGYGHHLGRNGELRVTVGPLTRTVDLLTKIAGCIWSQLSGRLGMLATLA